MHFQLRTDNHIKNSEELAQSVRAEVEAAIVQRHGERVRRIEVYLQDQNSHKGGVDTRCAIEVHLAGLPPITADSVAVDVETAVSGAVEKVSRALESRLGRLEDRGGTVSMSGEPT